MKTYPIHVGTDGTDHSNHEGAAAALVEASKRARHVVVGSRGHGVIAGTLLGSAGLQLLQLLHHARCPVYIARDHRRG
jgi:nucleotide-binding universal stress UspA family protein